ncbi:Putative heterokaryon incompatibility [Septoria linicola]|uniref:Heterokaryon incompatibility n=1 Tax=Septoria linicola TaxID=215465 RepID=A0A9Q9EQD4_9PEZI|nr:putative heterokaryon incompatibility [Septoria linicola]USW59010.1 Putative heterokaryon incompatibility [Septoria linicola]
MQHFIHEPLREPQSEAGPREIRVLSLCAGQPGSDVHITIEKQVMPEDLHGDQIVSEQCWEALSYTWGSDTQPRRTIIIEHSATSYAFEVRENLYFALQHLRNMSQPRRLWIDAICMDQSDTKRARREKAWQIPIMHEIYSAASGTLIWFGILRVRKQDIFQLVQLIMEGYTSSGLSKHQLLNKDSVHDLQSCISFILEHQLPFIFTDDGHVGLGVDSVQPGDMVAAVLGAPNLFLLRPAGLVEQQYLVGSCFLQGYNWGEALLGPLPEDVTVVRRLDPNRAVYHPHSLNLSTGNSSFWDPRLNWEVLEPADGEAAWTINAPLGEARMKVPTSDYFKTHHDSKIVDIFLL